LLNEAIAAFGIYTTWDFKYYPLSESILINNKTVTYLINSIDLLVLKSFIKATVDNVIKTGTLSLPIKGCKKRLFKAAFIREDGPNIVDLLFTNVVVIEGFNINIISKARLLKEGV
jgi:hypothetical protein